MPKHVRHQVTVDEFDQLPDLSGIQELLDGHVVEMPPPKLRHSALVKRIAQMLRRHVEDSRIWIETGFLIGKSCVQPDVAVIHPDQPVERDWYAGAPLIAIEVASRGNTPDDLEFKKDLYLANGAREVWIIFDKTRSMELYGQGGVNHIYLDLLRSNALNADINIGQVFD